MMKYLWLNPNLKDTSNMQTSGDFIGREYHIKVMEHPQHDCPKKAKRFRSAFTTDQVNYLEKQFKKFPYIGNTHRKEVAAVLKIPERAVKIWFQNRRMKEKKDSNPKEFDDGQGIRKSLEFAKDQLNNAGMPSTNEPARSLPLLTDTSPRTCDKNMIARNSAYNTRQLGQRVELKDSGIKTPSPTTPNVVTTSKVIHPPSVYVKTSNSPPDYKASINLSKETKSEYFTKSPKAERSFKKEVIDVKDGLPKARTQLEQMVPEDLSPIRKVNVPTMVQQQIIPENASNNSGYVSLVPTVAPFYPQPYISASGVIWKPVNVMPIVPSSSSPVTVSNNSLLNMPPVQESVNKRGCCCDCHVKRVMPHVTHNYQQQSPSPQYIITAMPFQNPSTKY